MNRKDLLVKLIRFSEPIDSLNKSLSHYSWDSEIDLVVIEKIHVIEVLNRYLMGELNNTDLEKWASAIECREDIEFEFKNKKTIKDIIFNLANPSLTGLITKDKIESFISNLE
jgi:hypothetical protein